jgi:hypothetical protein
MEKKDVLKILVILVLIALMINISMIFMRNYKLPDKTEENLSSNIFSQLKTEKQTHLVNNTLPIIENITVDNSTMVSNKTIAVQTATGIECLDRYNLTKKSIIFYNLNELHSNNMKPIVKDLESIYSFYWKNTTYDSRFNTCFEYSQATTPAFICAGTKRQLIGEVSKTSLESFAASCI